VRHCFRLHQATTTVFVYLAGKVLSLTPSAHLALNPEVSYPPRLTLRALLPPGARQDRSSALSSAVQYSLPIPSPMNADAVFVVAWAWHASEIAQATNHRSVLSPLFG
jgi:hypothetical protein